MISKNDIKFLRSLSQKKFRDQYKLFVVEGPKLLEEAINSGLKIKTIYTTDRSLGTDDANTVFINEKQLGQVSNLKTPNKSLAVVSFKLTPFSKEDLKGKATLVLDNINDPGNLGTIIRTADWFGIDNVLCSKGCVDQYNPKVVQSTMGSIFRINVHYTDLKELIGNSSIPTYGTFMNGENVYETSFPNEAMIVIGSESHGISNELATVLDHKITIPSKGEAESLNAAVATGIICSVITR